MEIKITNFKRNKNYCSLSFSDGRSCNLLYDTVLRYNLREDSVLEEKQLKTIISEDHSQLCFNKLTDILSRKPCTTFEAKKKLSMKGFNSYEIKTALDKAFDLKLINDLSVAENYISELANKGYGRRRIIDSLKHKGLDSETVKALLPDSEKDNEIARGETVFLKKLKSLQKNKNLSEQKIKERVFRFMQGRGFSNDIIFDLLRKSWIDSGKINE